MNNRELKFRAWDGELMFHSDSEDDNSIWRLHPHGMVCETYQLIDSCPGGMYHEQEEKWIETPGTEYMQYTGLKDKNGVEIYEGDILENRYEDKCEESGFGIDRTYVAFENGCFGWVGSITNKMQAFDETDIDYWEVIGNIYEHPHLLKEEATV